MVSGLSEPPPPRTPTFQPRCVMARSVYGSKAILWELLSGTEGSWFCLLPFLFFFWNLSCNYQCFWGFSLPGILIDSRQNSLLGSNLELAHCWSIGLQMVRLSDTCVRRGRGRWWERVRNVLGGKDQSMWNLTQNKALVIRTGGSSDYNAGTVLRLWPWSGSADWVLRKEESCGD